MADRRASARLSTRIPARLRLASGDRSGELLDISQSGTRMALAQLPPEGAPALLEWAGHEAFCQVMWVANGMCGLRFDRPIARALVLEANGQDTAPASAAPVASHNNIPMGQKRARPGAAG